MERAGENVIGEKGELVRTRPFVSMPVGFWRDDDGSRYRDAYFADNAGVWTHGDFIEVRPEGGVVIYGRSDTTLNPGGVRIGTAEIYRAMESIPEISDAIAVGHSVNGDVEVVLFVVPTAGVTLDDDLIARIKTRIRVETSPRHVPGRVLAVSAVPYTISGKKVEKGSALDRRRRSSNQPRRDRKPGSARGVQGAGVGRAFARRGRPPKRPPAIRNSQFARTNLASVKVFPTGDGRRATGDNLSYGRPATGDGRPASVRKPR